MISILFIFALSGMIFELIISSKIYGIDKKIRRRSLYHCPLTWWPGAAGEMKPVAQMLSKSRGVLEFLQTADSVNGQIEELNRQIISVTTDPIIIAGYSWGAWLAVLLVARYPERVKQVILISSGAFDSKYNTDLLKIRLTHLTASESEEAVKLLSDINSGNANDALFARFGELMAKADSYCPVEEEENNNDMPDIHIYHKVWSEADELRKNGTLKECLKNID